MQVPRNKVWQESSNMYYLEYPKNIYQELENVIYTVNKDPLGRFYLAKMSNEYTFDYKVYGLETDFIDRVEKTYNTTNNNLGVLLNGTKGTGKTVCCKNICNRVNQPTILVDTGYENLQHYLNSIPQDITIFIDEYEKIYGESNEMLTIMDGAHNSEYKRLFLMTTNKLYIEDNLKQRPSRVRYLKTFEDLEPHVVEEIIDDVLINTDFKEDCLKFVSSLELITVDIVKEILNEVNIHNESPFEFEEIFNAKMRQGKYKLFNVDSNGNTTLAMNNANIYPRPNYNEGSIGRHFSLGDNSVGEIVRVIDNDTVMVANRKLNEEGETTDELSAVFVIRAEKTYTTHYSYAYGDYDDEYGWGTRKDSNATQKAQGFVNILENITDEEYRKLSNMLKPIPTRNTGELTLKASEESWDSFQEPVVSQPYYNTSEGTVSFEADSAG